MDNKDFELIAEVVRHTPLFFGETKSNQMVSKAMRKALAERFADKLHSTSPNFDREKFLKACGVDE